MIIYDNFKFEIIRRNKEYLKQFKFISDFANVYKTIGYPLQNDNDLRQFNKFLRTVDKSITKLYGIPTSVTKESYLKTTVSIRKKIEDSWTINPYHSLPIPWKKEETDLKAKKKSSNLKYEILPRVKYILHMKDKKTLRWFEPSSTLKGLEDAVNRGVQLFIAIHPTCTKVNLRKINLTKEIKRVYECPNIQRPREWRTDILLWELVQTKDSKFPNKTDLFKDLALKHDAFQNKRHSWKSIERQYNRINDQIQEFPLS